MVRVRGGVSGVPDVVEAVVIRILNEDCLTALPRLAVEGLRAHAVVCDPPYHLSDIGRSVQHKRNGNGSDRTGQRNYAERGFMGKAWDGGDVAFRAETWAAVMECMRPGAFLLAFGGTRTYHRLAVAIEDAGFEVRDVICWHYGSGFPKSHDVSRGIDKAAGAEREVVGVGQYSARGRRTDNAVYGQSSPSDNEVITAPATPEAAQWAGWGTALKPATELICVARKPLIGTVAANVLAHGCGGLNVDACRVDSGGTHGSADRAGLGAGRQTANAKGSAYNKGLGGVVAPPHPAGRWPANVIHDGSPEVEAAFAAFGDKSSVMANGNPNDPIHDFRDTGTASRFFFSAKATAADRADSKHPTVKPAALMEWLVKLVCPSGGLVLDPFAGTGSTGLAADRLGMDAVLIERDATYAADARRKIKQDAPLFAGVAPW